MSLDRDSTLSTATDKFDPLNPVDSDGDVITFSGNLAHIEGTLAECAEFMETNSLHFDLFANRATLVRNGKLAVNDPNTVYFLSGILSDGPYDVHKPAPSGKERLRLANEALKKAGETEKAASE